MLKALMACALLACCPLSAEKIVQCIANFPIDADAYTRVFKQHGDDIRVISVDIKDYESALLKKKGLINQIVSAFKKPAIPENVIKIVFFNVTPKVARKYDLSKFPKEKLVLFMWEPKTVLPLMYSSDILQHFSKVYTWDDSLIDKKTFFKFHYPEMTPMIEEIPSFEEKKFCTLVSSDLKSTEEKELYTERKVAIRYFEENGEEGFEFYGRRWDPAQYKSYRGPIDDKITTTKKYCFSICYENTHGTPGYITEKIFDAFAAGIVPVYWGASNVESYIPSDCFIDRRAFNSMEELHRFLKDMKKEEYEGYLTRIRAFLSSDDAQKFTFNQLLEDFYQAVTLKD